MNVVTWFRASVIVSGLPLASYVILVRLPLGSRMLVTGKIKTSGESSELARWTGGRNILDTFLEGERLKK
ncbi:MAG TPA: hypothetical protein PK614_05605 [Nitrospira sp.]|nr:hypothetical protein [Nitrospira sp.]